MMSNYIEPLPLFRIYPVRGLLGSFHLLFDVSRQEAVIIDAGFIGEMPKLRRLLGRIGIGWGDIKAILLTHGHLDHVGQLAKLKKLTGAPIIAHRLEQVHVDGIYPYTGASRLCGLLEACGRWAMQYRATAIDQVVEPGHELPYWGGLSVVHLPGHTQGHCGFHSKKANLLFSGDLFASYWFNSHTPPPFLNSCPEYLRASFQEVALLSPDQIIPNHYDALDGALHRKRFDKMFQRLELV